MTTICYKPVTRYTRAGKNGKQLKCPKCQSVRTIYHFNWSGLTCPDCKESIDKYDWLVESKGSWLNCPYSVRMSYRLSPLHPYISNFTFLFMSTLANESIFETLFEEALEEIGINESSPFYADAYKIAQQMAMNKFLSNNP